MKRSFAAILSVTPVIVLGVLFVYFTSASPQETDTDLQEIIDLQVDTMNEEDHPEIDNEGIDTLDDVLSETNSFQEILLGQDTSRSIPFGNGKGLAEVSDATIGLYTDSGSVYLARFKDDGYDTLQLASSGNAISMHASSLSTNGDDVLALWNGAMGIYAAFSSDGGLTWTEEEIIEGRSAGAQVPTSCLWQQDGELHAMASWVDPPISGDGGPLYVRSWKNGQWSETVEVGNRDLATSPSLNCEDNIRQLMFRDGETNKLRVWYSEETDGTWSEPTEEFGGADSHIAVCNGRIWVGHHNVGAHLSWSDDNGETWEKETLDGTGKFGSIACYEDTVIVSWGHYTSLYAAQNREPDSRSVYAKISIDGGETWASWKPVGEEVNQNVSVVSAGPDGVSIMWELPGAIRFSTLGL
jgi:hypothetical protein